MNIWLKYLFYHASFKLHEMSNVYLFCLPLYPQSLAQSLGNYSHLNICLLNINECSSQYLTLKTQCSPGDTNV